MRQLYKSENAGRDPSLSSSADLQDNANEDSMQTEAAMNAATDSATEAELEKPYLPGGNKILLQNWFVIRSPTFGNNKKFPEIELPDGQQKVEYLKDFSRINPQYIKGGKIPSQLHFWFRLTPFFMYYTYNKQDLTLAGSFNVRKNIADLRWLPGSPTCMQIFDKNENVWNICEDSVKTLTLWFCKLLKMSGLQKEEVCDPKNYLGMSPGKILIKTVTQPLIIIPMPSKYCNSNWSYAKHGADWECTCKEGKEQSPIDLPPPKKAVENEIKPLFEYEFIDSVMTEDYGPGNLKSGEKNVVKYEAQTLRIKHPNFGKIVTLDGTVYIAQEIVFHTPSEHKVDGGVYDMEMQIIHNGKSVGDTLKKVILSFLFRAKPGVFNKFIDKLNFFDLPNPIEKYREIDQTLYIPHILLNSDDEDLSIMVPFSFYTYQGSLTTPPCNESVIHYIASKPIELSNTALELFKEALRNPDRVDHRGNIVSSTSFMDNNRLTQPLNGRTIFHYDHTKYNCPDFRRKAPTNNLGGHYEKRVKSTAEYFFVNGMSPSGVPNAYVVPEKEANN
jgi:carbonic anhydrase